MYLNKIQILFDSIFFSVQFLKESAPKYTNTVLQSNKELCTSFSKTTLNSGIGSRLLDWIYDFKKCNEHEAQQVCSENRPISLNKWLNNLLVITSNALQYS